MSARASIGKWFHRDAACATAECHRGDLLASPPPPPASRGGLALRQPPSYPRGV